MEIEYKKDGSHSYMVIPSVEFDENDYQLQMILNNKIEELLPMKINYLNNSKELCYETTSKISLPAVYGRKQMGRKDVIGFIEQLKKVSDLMREYLLDFNHIIFDPDCVFWGRKDEKIYFCYCPVSQGEAQETMRKLFDSLLEWVDHNDRDAVEIVYGIQQITISDSYSIQDILDLVETVGERRRKEAYEQSNVKEENIFEIEESKKSFWYWLKKWFRRDKYQDEEELEHHTDMEMTAAESIQADFEDATVFLASSGSTYFITLKSRNLEKPIVIQPNIFPCIFGKSRKSSDYIIDSPVVSRVHMKLSADDNGFYIEDLNSTNGTYLNEIKLAPHTMTEIKEGDVISIANIEFLVE